MPTSPKSPSVRTRVYRAADDRAGFTTRSLLAVPLVDENELVGVVEVVNKHGGGGFNESDQRVMEMFSSQAASVITRSRLIEENLRSERLAAVGHTVAGLSHYAKNILNGMMGGVDLVDKGLGSGNAKLLHAGWPILKRSIARITNVVEDMLAYSKPREPLFQDYAVRGLLDEAADSFRGLLVDQDIVLDVECDPEVELFVLDPYGIHRCFLNLLTNAGDVVPARGGKIGLRARRTDGGGLEIEVTDNGPGVPAPDRERIFDPFHSSKGSKGTGLGLAVTRTIVEEHGGEILVDSGASGGASFRIRLPHGGTADPE